MQPCFSGDDWAPACQWEAEQKLWGHGFGFFWFCFALVFYLFSVNTTITEAKPIFVATFLLRVQRCFYVVLHARRYVPESNSLPRPTRGQWASGCMVLNCQLWLNLSPFNNYATYTRKKINYYLKRPPSHIYTTNVENINHYLIVYRLSIMKLKEQKARMLLSSVRRETQQNQDFFFSL